MISALFGSDSDSSGEEPPAAASVSVSASAYPANILPSTVGRKKTRSHFSQNEIMKIVDAAKFLTAYGESQGEAPSLFAMTDILNKAVSILKMKNISVELLRQFLNGSSTIASRKISDVTKSEVDFNDSAVAIPSAAPSSSSSSSSSCTDADAHTSSANRAAADAQVLSQATSSTTVHGITIA